MLLSPSVVTISRLVFLTIKKEIEDEIQAIRESMTASNEPLDQGGAFPQHSSSSFVLDKAAELGALKEGEEKFLFHMKPMSGMPSILFAIQLCKTLDLYGFDAFTSNEEQKYHYFDDRKGKCSLCRFSSLCVRFPLTFFSAFSGFTHRHSFDLAVEIYRRISQEIPLRLQSREGKKLRSFVSE